MKWMAIFLAFATPAAADDLEDFLNAVGDEIPAPAKDKKPAKTMKSTSPMFKIPSYVLGPNRPMQFRVEGMTMPECIEMARDFSGLFAAFGKAATVSEQKNEAVYSVCFMGKLVELACRSPGDWVTAKNLEQDCR